MKRILIALTLLTCANASAQWTTNAWPSYDWPRKGIVHARECYSGVVERASVLGLNPIDVMPTNQPYLGNKGTNAPGSTGTNFWYRSGFGLAPFAGEGQRDSLVALKSEMLAHIVTLYADCSQTNASGVFGGATLTNLPIFTEVSICQAAEIPTNFFNFTPYRGLNGAGPFTNDTTTPAPHGWTNSTTAVGGTNFPAARTNATWYTTDYGWQGLKDMIDLCKWTELSPQSGVEVFRNYSPGDFFDSCNEAYTDATNDWADATTSTNNPSVNAEYEVGLMFLEGASYSAERSFAYSGDFNVPTTNSLQCSIDVYYKYTPYTQDPSGGTNNFFDIDSTGKTNGLWWFFESYAEAGTTNRGFLAEASAIGKTSLTDPFLDWPISCPVSGNTLASTNWNGSGEYGVWGGIDSQDDWILKWDGPNGFSFIE